MTSGGSGPSKGVQVGKSLVSRRGLLLGAVGVGLAGVAAGAGALGDALPEAPTLRRAVSATGPEATIPDAPKGKTTVERLYSTARHQNVDLVIMRPYGVDPEGLPVCLVLHGRGGTARGYLQFGLPQFLSSATRAGVPPFTAVAVDLGKDYLMDEHGDNPMAMIVDELPRWLERRDLPVPMAALGFSMGGFAAVNYARHRPDLRAIALASPAMFLRWADAKKRNCFRDEQQWREFEPLDHTAELSKDTAIGLWCGSEDSFAEAAREFTAKARPEVHSISRGGHNTPYWWRVLPEVMRFLGTHLGDSATKR
jgi:pimeloyl-ACP methyl ester carboxylesterase